MTDYWLKKIKLSLNYKDVYLVPSKTIVDSRKQCNTSVQLGKHIFDMPIYPANMKSVVNMDTCIYLAKQGYFYTMHRFNVRSVDIIEEAIKNNIFSSISVGVNEDSYTDLRQVIQKGYTPDYITLDIANAWCVKAERMVNFINKNFPTSFLIVGNVATSDAVKEIQQWERVDALKVGIAGGCFIKGTKIKTNNGLKNIENIDVNDYVFTHKNRLKKVLATTSRKEEDCIITITYNGKQIKTTSNHEFYVVKKTDKEQINDNNIHDFAFWIEAKDLSDEYLLISIK